MINRLINARCFHYVASSMREATKGENECLNTKNLKASKDD